MREVRAHLDPALSLEKPARRGWIAQSNIYRASGRIRNKNEAGIAATGEQQHQRNHEGEGRPEPIWQSEPRSEPQHKASLSGAYRKRHGAATF